MRSHSTKLALLLFALSASLVYGSDQAPPPEVLSAKTVYVLVRIGNVGQGKYKPDEKRAKSQVTKDLQKWGRFRIADRADKADLVLVVTEGHTSVYGTSYGAEGAMGGRGGITSVAAPDVLSDTLEVYKAGALDETAMPLASAAPALYTANVSLNPSRGKTMTEAPIGTAPPLWKAIETGDDFDWPAVRVVKKFRKAVEKASK